MKLTGREHWEGWDADDAALGRQFSVTKFTGSDVGRPPNKLGKRLEGP